MNKTVFSPCPVCHAAACPQTASLFDDRYGYPGSFSLLRCKNCHHAFLDCRLSDTQLTELYTHYYPRKTFELAQYRPHTEPAGFESWFGGLKSSAFRWVPKNVRVLDVGCGFGESLGYHQARGCDVYGVEADENIRRVADKFGFKVHVGLFDATLYEAEFFDYVTMDQVIEHVNDPPAVLQGVARILKQGGTAVLSTPNAKGWGARLFGRRWINWHAPYHVQFFSRRSMRQAARHAGLTVVAAKTITNSQWLHYQWIHLLTYPQAGNPSAFWSPNKGAMTHWQWRGLKLLSWLHKSQFNHLLTRLFDGIGLGDNFVFILKKP